MHLYPFHTGYGLSPLGYELVDGDVGPHLPGEAREGVLLVGQLGIQLPDLSLRLQSQVQAGLKGGGVDVSLHLKDPL